VAHADDRRSYRLHFPERAVPAFETAGASRIVLDMSESGLRYQLGDADTVPELEAEFEGLLKLHEGRRVELRVTVARVSGREVSCRLSPPGLPLNVMFAEQRWLLRRYPLLFRAAS
jgi:hypothetical protein